MGQESEEVQRVRLRISGRARRAFPVKRPWPARIMSKESWLAEAGERAALPRAKRREDYAVEVRTELLERQNSQAHKIMARTSSRERIDGWAGLLKQPQVRFFAYCPQDAIS